MEQIYPPSSPAPASHEAPAASVTARAHSEDSIPRFRAFPVWLIGFFLTVAASTLSFIWIDVPVAHHFADNADRFGIIAAGLSGMVLLAVESAVVVGFLLLRILRGELSPLAKAVTVSSIASICAYLLNEVLLKFLFGVPSPPEMLFQNAGHAIHFLSGDVQDGFPSGHMMLAGAFAGAFIRAYPRMTGWLFSLLALGALILVWGDWHFVSDVIAGTFLGVTVGLVVAHPGAVQIVSNFAQNSGLLRRARA